MEQYEPTAIIVFMLKQKKFKICIGSFLNMYVIAYIYEHFTLW